MKSRILLILAAVCGNSFGESAETLAKLCECPSDNCAETKHASCECSACGSTVPSAPISVMGDHTHEEGGWMLSYRYMFMDMDGMYHGSNAVSPASVYGANYIISPQRMTMDMHMLGVMHAPTDDVTLMAMLPYTSMEMSHVIAPGAAPLIALNGGSRYFTTKSDGIGDLKISALIDLYDQGAHHVHGGIGISLPTGSISETDLIPGPGGLLQRQLPAAMQMGSGTVDLLPSLTYLYHDHESCWSGGVQASGVIRTHRNSHDYQLGHVFNLDSWLSWSPRDWVSFTGGLSYNWQGELQGIQENVTLRPPFAPARFTVPTAYGSNYGGHRIDAIMGVNFLVTGGLLENHRLAFDVRLPLWQHVNGYRLGTDITVTGGWQYIF